MNDPGAYLRKLLQVLKDMRKAGSWEEEGAKDSLGAESLFETLEQSIEDVKRKFYGVTTGFGKLSDVVIPLNRLAELQVNLIRSHAAGVGNPLPEEEVRAIQVVVVQQLVDRAVRVVRAEHGTHRSSRDRLEYGVPPCQRESRRNLRVAVH